MAKNPPKIVLRQIEFITWITLYPRDDTTPLRVPAMNAPPGCIIKSAIAPTATPPLKVAF